MDQLVILIDYYLSYNNYYITNFIIFNLKPINKKIYYLLNNKLNKYLKCSKYKCKLPLYNINFILKNNKINKNYYDANLKKIYFKKNYDDNICLFKFNNNLNNKCYHHINFCKWDNYKCINRIDKQYEYKRFGYHCFNKIYCLKHYRIKLNIDNNKKFIRYDKYINSFDNKISIIGSFVDKCQGEYSNIDIIGYYDKNNVGVYIDEIWPDDDIKYTYWTQ